MAQVPRIKGQGTHASYHQPRCSCPRTAAPNPFPTMAQKNRVRALNAKPGNLDHSHEQMGAKADSYYLATFPVSLPSPTGSLPVLLLKCTTRLLIDHPNPLSLHTEDRGILSSLLGEGTKLRRSRDSPKATQQVGSLDFPQTPRQLSYPLVMKCRRLK